VAARGSDAALEASEEEELARDEGEGEVTDEEGVEE